jgi:peroxiredoxin
LEGTRRQTTPVTVFRSLVYLFVLVAALWIASARPWTLLAQPSSAPWAAPDFTHGDPEDWINSRPLKLADLEGRVVLLDFWTYGCWNCTRSLLWIKELETRFGDRGLVAIGVHTPEFKHEKNVFRVREQVARLELDHPVMVDNDFSYWKAMNNRYWPTFYLIDKSGQVRDRAIGETHSGDANATRIEARIEALLAETVRDKLGSENNFF